MVNVYYDQDADLARIADKTIGIIGYGSQGHAHALNLKDNGQNVVVGLYPGSSSIATAEAAGLRVAEVPTVAAEADVIMMVIPDHVQGRIYREQIAPNLKPGSAFMVAHGFSIHYGEIVLPDNMDVMMVAPKAPGHRMRELFVEGVGVPSLLAVHQDATGNAKQIGLAYAKGIGCTGAGVLETTIKDETESDLFGEQSDSVRRGHRPGQRRLRDPGGSGIPAGNRLLRVSARAEDDRGPDVPGRPQLYALLGERHRRVRLAQPPQPHHRRARAREHAGRVGGNPGRHFRPRVDRRER